MYQHIIDYYRRCAVLYRDAGAYISAQHYSFLAHEYEMKQAYD